MENLTFVKTVFHGGDIRRSEAGPFVRLHFTSEFTQAILDQVGWDDPGESSKKTRLDNPSSLPGGSLVLTPDADALKKHEVSLSFSGAKDFDLVTVSDGDYRRREFRFSLVRAGVSNAYALPGGFVFITEPLLDLCAEDRDELAFLLGHEMGHVIRGHARSQLTANTFLHAVTARLSGAGPMLRQLIDKGYSRELELEADAEGARLAAAAGFDARAAARALRRLALVSRDHAGLAEYFSSHPPLAERIRRLEQRP